MTVYRTLESLSGYLLTATDVARIYKIRKRRFNELVRKGDFRVPQVMSEPFLRWSRSDVAWDLTHASYERDQDALHRREIEAERDRRWQEKQRSHT